MSVRLWGTKFSRAYSLQSIFIFLGQIAILEYSESLHFSEIREYLSQMIKCALEEESFTHSVFQVRLFRRGQLLVLVWRLHVVWEGGEGKGDDGGAGGGRGHWDQRWAEAEDDGDEDAEVRHHPGEDAEPKHLSWDCRRLQILWRPLWWAEGDRGSVRNLTLRDLRLGLVNYNCRWQTALLREVCCLSGHFSLKKQLAWRSLASAGTRSIQIFLVKE